MLSKNYAMSTSMNQCICDLVKIIMTRRIKNLYPLERVLQKLIDHSQDNDLWPKLFLIILNITENFNSFLAHRII